MSDAKSMSPASQASQTLAFNMKLLAQHEMEGFGGMGEGINMQMAKDGRRIIWMAHESAPKNFTALDVTDPRNPKFVIQTDLPHSDVRSNSLDVVGNTMVVAYQTKGFNNKPAGFDIFDITVPEKPKLISHFDCSGQFSRGVHCVWFDDGEYVHIASGAPDLNRPIPRMISFIALSTFAIRPSRSKPAAGGCRVPERAIRWRHRRG